MKKYTIGTVLLKYWCEEVSLLHVYNMFTKRGEDSECCTSNKLLIKGRRK